MKKIVSKLGIDCFDHDCEHYTHFLYVDGENRAFFIDKEHQEEKHHIGELKNFMVENAEELELITGEGITDEEQ